MYFYTVVCNFQNRMRYIYVL